MKEKQIRIEVVDVTPLLAREWLSENINTNNRTLKKSHVVALAKAIHEGHWRETGDTIKFGADGTLYDGQHRLAAIIMADTSLRLHVARDLAPAARLNIDTGALRRDVADTLTITQGNHGWRRKVAMIRVIRSLYESTNSALSTDEAQNWYARFRVGLDWAATLPGGRSGLAFSPISGALAFAFSYAPDAVTTFADRAHSGEGHTKNSPALVFRESVLLGRTTVNSYMHRREITLKTLRAVYAFIKNEEMIQIKVSESTLAVFKKYYEIEAPKAA